ncbi:endolytic transglycosylase MltG [Alcanivorax sp. 1008]|uniref:endolytic transglycosylase MltG n=1 Tax=Alcanivorax sp. 1008 TaxID=2816853 RepID=UPI001DDACFCC|nr:endolytic transglycosylase MltG [Alcanivorax sp. 1008]MCC1497705.1 endolytic transglycosylase MltG [Alcanivorax sp. 1008]
MRAKYVGLLALLVAFTAVGTLFWLAGHVHRPLQVEQEQVVSIAPGSSLNGVLRKFAREGLLGDPGEAKRRRLGARLYDLFTDISQRIQVGEYALKPGDTLLQLLLRIERGDVVQRSFTLIEGWNMRELRAALTTAPSLRQTLEGMDDNALMAALGLPGESPEGWFAPDTWHYTSNDSDLDLLRRAFERQQTLVNDAWSSRAANLPYSDAYDVLIMASIIEKETGVPSERGEIAGVFVERLRRGMRLQTDPTVIYGMGERYNGRIRSADLREPTPWNTYVIKGLPPTPIAMPGADAIRAAVAPAQTQALFFVARGDGSHVFSRTLEEHNRAVREFQLRRREDYRSSPAPAGNTP